MRRNPFSSASTRKTHDSKIVLLETTAIRALWLRAAPRSFSNMRLCSLALLLPYVVKSEDLTFLWDEAHDDADQRAVFEAPAVEDEFRGWMERTGRKAMSEFRIGEPQKNAQVGSVKHNATERTLTFSGVCPCCCYNTQIPGLLPKREGLARAKMSLV